MQKFSCEICHKHFKRYPSTRRGLHIFCSFRCKGKWEAKLRKGHSQPGFSGWSRGMKLPAWSGKKSWNWKGGKNRNTLGYILVYAPDHPHNIRKYVFEHRLVMEKLLGRFLSRHEIVHHINGDRSDNRIENLQLFGTHSEHITHHHNSNQTPSL